MDKNLRNVLLFFFVCITIILSGVVGYISLEGYSFLDALYMTIITISTVGYQEVYPLSQTGKIFTIILIIFGITLALYGLSAITVFFVEGELKKYLKGVKMKKEIKNIANHYIICGAGKTGQKIMAEFLHLGEPFIVVEESDGVADALEAKFPETSLLLLRGDATRDEILISAGISRAKALIGVLANDAENVFLTLTAKSLNQDIRVITRAIETSSEKKLKKAGADTVVSQIDIAAQRISTTALNPNIESFLDIITRVGDENFRIDFVKVSKKSDFSGILLRDAQIPQKTNLIVIGIKKGENIMINPMSMTSIEQSDELIILGKEEQIKTIRKIARGLISLTDI
ncbi:potassium channel family protein [Chitinivibrio alkaliphilus]|uniref:TrkA-N domain protein n=1 Tax=Chitinivibrio alkaliphilus ACht1 TaxID=1313304 RepID=U7DBF5_9BACT|nr:potassium channel protein [Chitinivibrio alkaliphilus]ERP39347.1 TrkA-N domain protein [Chitinivibrio alkaliphilus ACht1]